MHQSLFPFLSDLLRSIIIQRACCSELLVSRLLQQLAALVLCETVCDIANSLLPDAWSCFILQYKMVLFYPDMPQKHNSTVKSELCHWLTTMSQLSLLHKPAYLTIRFIFETIYYCIHCKYVAAECLCAGLRNVPTLLGDLVKDVWKVDEFMLNLASVLWPEIAFSVRQRPGDPTPHTWEQRAAAQTAKTQPRV